MFGIGGGLLIGPLLLLVMGMPEKLAIGTSLGVVTVPVVILGTLAHYRAGNINIRYSALIAMGVFAGAYFGAQITIGAGPGVVKRIYGAFLFVIGARMLFWGK